MEKPLNVNDIDRKKRTPNEWSEIYNFKLFDDLGNDLWSEYEWAYNILDKRYMNLPDEHNGNILDTCIKSGEMELRAMEIKADLFNQADIGERHILKDKYIDTTLVRQTLSLNI